MTGGAITTPQSKIENAIAVFTLAVRFAEGCESDIIAPEFGWREVRIITGGPGVTIAPYKYTKEKLVDQSFNLMLAALGSTALAVDEALDQKFGSKNPADTTNLGSARTVLYQIRNAFAHQPLAPTWMIKDKYQRLWEVQLNGLKIEFDGTALDGKSLKLEDFGGLEGYLRLLNYFHAQVSK